MTAETEASTVLIDNDVLDDVLYVLNISVTFVDVKLKLVDVFSIAWVSVDKMAGVCHTPVRNPKFIHLQSHFPRGNFH